MNKQYELVNFCEFDKYAIKSYCAIHNIAESLNLGDITKVDEKQLKDFNFICGGSPCQDFSIAGKQKGSMWKCNDCGEEYNPLTVHYTQRQQCPKCGNKNLDKTRSSLLVEWLRIICEKKPNFGIYENVKNIVGKQFKETTFKLFEEELHEYGYNTYWKVLNAKDYGIPQNRERLFLILIKKELDNDKFTFPKKVDLKISLNDILEKEVDEKFFIKIEKNTDIIKERFFKQASQTFYSNSCDCGDIIDAFNKRVNKSGICPTLTTRPEGFKTAILPIVLNKNGEKTARKLTPSECFTLMGFDDNDIKKIKKNGLTNKELYKQAGNSIVVDCVYYILKELYMAMPYLFEDLKVGSFFSGIGAFEKALDRLFLEQFN